MQRFLATLRNLIMFEVENVQFGILMKNKRSDIFYSACYAVITALKSVQSKKKKKKNKKVEVVGKREIPKKRMQSISSCHHCICTIVIVQFNCYINMAIIISTT